MRPFRYSRDCVQGWLAGLPALPNAVVFIACATTILLTGAALHYAIEKPFLRWRDRLRPLRRDDAATAAA